MDALPEICVRSADDATVVPYPVENLLSGQEQEQLRRIATCLDCKRGTVLYAQGQEARFIYLVSVGIVRINHCDETGHRQVLAFRVPGDFCGIPHEGYYFNSAETVSHSKIYRIELHQLEQAFLTEPHLQAVMLRKILHEYRQAQARISTLGQQNTCQRLASCLLDFIIISEFYDEERSCLRLPVNRFDLADYLGTTPESTARAFAKLESLGLIRRITARKIELLDSAGLRRVHCTPRRRYSDREAQSSVGSAVF